MNEQPDFICGNVIDCSTKTYLKLITYFLQLNLNYSCSHRLKSYDYVMHSVILFVWYLRSEIKESKRK